MREISRSNWKKKVSFQFLWTHNLKAHTTCSLWMMMAFSTETCALPKCLMQLVALSCAIKGPDHLEACQWPTGGFAPGAGKWQQQSSRIIPKWSIKGVGIGLSSSPHHPGPCAKRTLVLKGVDCPSSAGPQEAQHLPDVLIFCSLHGTLSDYFDKSTASYNCFQSWGTKPSLSRCLPCSGQWRSPSRQWSQIQWGPGRWAKCQEIRCKENIWKNSLVPLNLTNFHISGMKSSSLSSSVKQAWNDTRVEIPTVWWAL